MAVRALVTACILVTLGVAHAVDVDVAAGNRSLSFDLPEAAFADDDSQLFVDLDGYDVTGFARIDGNRIHVDFDVALDTGEHSLALVVFHPDRGEDILFDVVIDIAQTDTSAWSFNTLFETNYRAADHPGAEYAGVDSVSSSGSVSMATSKSSGNWGIGAAMDLVYDEASGSIPGGDEWLLPSYELYGGYGGETASAWAVAGNIAVSREDLLFYSYQRRGAALEASAGSGRFSLQAFSVNSMPRSGFDGDYILPGDASDRTNGISTEWVVVDKRFELGGAFVDGKSAFGGDGYSPQFDPLIYGGDSWNLSVDSRWFDDSLWIHVERAASDFDADGLGTGLPSASDDAIQAMLQLSSSGELGTGPFEYWSAVLQHSKVGRDFYSLGNLSLPGNVEANSAWLQGGFTSVVVDVEVSMEKTNPDNNPLFPTQTLDRAGMNLAWSPASLNQDTGAWKLLGAPSLSAWAYRSDSSQPDSDALLAGFDVDNSTNDSGVSLNFARDALNWSIEYGLVDYDDHSMTVIDNGFIVYEPYSDSRNRHLSIAASWQASERIALDLFLQRNTLEETDFGDEYRTINYGVSGNFLLVPGKLSLFTSYSKGKDRNLFGDPQFLPEQFEQDYASLHLNWRVHGGEGQASALNLFFKGNYGRSDGFMIDEDFWAMYIGATLNWMGSKE